MRCLSLQLFLGSLTPLNPALSIANGITASQTLIKQKVKEMLGERCKKNKEGTPGLFVTGNDTLIQGYRVIPLSNDVLASLRELDEIEHDRDGIEKMTLWMK